MLRYEAALDGYRQIVDRWLLTLADSLEHYVLMPMRIVGFVGSGRESRGGLGGAIPLAAGFVEALPPGMPNQVDMQLGGYSFELGDHSLAQQRAVRPQAARRLTGTHGGMTFEVGDRFPISDVVYGWLAHELKQLGLIGSLSAGRSRDAITPSDL